MSYIDDNLVPGEQVVLRARPHPAALLIPIAVMILSLFIVAAIGKGIEAWGLIVFFLFVFFFILILRLAITFFTTEFGLTNLRVVAKTGLIRRQSLELFLAKVESISIAQGLAGRIFGYGTVVVVGSGGTRQAFPMIGNAQELRRRVNTQIATT